jgi:hypothetical protein
MGIFPFALPCSAALCPLPNRAELLRPLLSGRIHRGARYEVVKKLLVLVLFVSCAGFASSGRSPSAQGSPQPPPQTDTGPHTIIPKNCIQTQEADGSVLVTCDCEACGHPEARDGMTPLPYACAQQNNAVTCGYDREWNDQKKTHI